MTELHGGHVRYELRPDGAQGARFVVDLPRHGRRNEVRGAAVVSGQGQLSPMSILVVDDNRDSADTLASLLRLDGHRVEVAYDGEQAVLAALRMRPRLVVLDLGLPKLGGLAVARRFRDNSGIERPLLIAVSGYAQEKDQLATAAAGFDGHLAKPVALDDLYRVIRHAWA